MHARPMATLQFLVHLKQSVVFSVVLLGLVTGPFSNTLVNLRSPLITVLSNNRQFDVIGLTSLAKR